MSSRVGTAIPASRSTAWSSAAVGFTRSIQTALSGSAARSAQTTFFSEASEGTNIDNIKDSGTEPTTQQDLARFWQALHDGPMSADPHFAPLAATRWRPGGADPAVRTHLPKNQPQTAELATKKTQPGAATRDGNLNSGIMSGFDDNRLNGIVAFGLHAGVWNARFSTGSAKCRRCT